MASANNEICDIIKKCKILLLDIEGTTTSISFVKDKLFPYAEENVKEFLDSHWESEDVKEAVAALRKLAIEDQENKLEGVVAISGEDAAKEEQIEGLVKSVKWQMSSDRKAGPLKQLQGLIWKRGYDKGEIKGHVFDDVSPALEQWRSVDGQKVYIYSSGSVQAQKLLFGQSEAGDLLPMIEGHFDTAVGAKQEPASYVAITEKIGCKPEDILFLTDIVKEAEAARASGLQTALVSREGNAPLPADAAAAFPVLHSLEQLTVTNKRKPEPQEEELPAKVPKTDIADDVKTASDSETASEIVTDNNTDEAPVATENGTATETVAQPEKNPDTAVPEIATETETIAKVVDVPCATEPEGNAKVADEPEKMEVEEQAPVAESVAELEKVVEAEAKPVSTEMVIEEVTDATKDIAEIEEIKPTVEESVEKTVNNETEKMETESTEVKETMEAVSEPKESTEEKVELTAPVAEETPPTVVTEIQDITEDAKSLGEVDTMDDLEPIVEEPNGDMEELQNVGEVLEKECDEILSKVQDVTNLESMTVKPMLNSIAEESECGENTNDIVEGILDSEMELGMKACEDIDLNTVQEITDAKVDATEEKTENVKGSTDEVKIADEEKQAEVVAEEKKVTEERMKESNSADTVKEEIKKDESSPTAEVTNGDAKKTEPEVSVEKTEVSGKKVEATENITESEIKVTENKAESNESAAAPIDNKIVSEESAAESIDNKMETEESTETAKENKSEEKVAEETIAEVESKIEEPEKKVKENNMDNKEAPELKSEVTEAIPEAKDSASEEVKMEEVTDKQVNGKTTNGDAEVNLNGDASNNEELSSRLSVENGENGKELNGANGNGDSTEEKGQGDNKIEPEIADIKVKTVATDEPRGDPIEQPTEA